MELVQLAVVGGLVATAFVWWRRRSATAWRRPVLIGGMMKRQGIGFGRVLELGLEDDLATRAIVCLACAEFPECQARLDRPGAVAYRDICPNAGFLDSLRGASGQDGKERLV